jgi:hypothetical protein
MEYGSRVADGYGIRRDEGCGNGLLPAMSVLSVRVLLVGKGGHVEVPTPRRCHSSGPGFYRIAGPMFPDLISKKIVDRL